MDDKIKEFEKYNSIFNITEYIGKFELYTDTFDEFSFDELKEKLGEVPCISDITPSHLQHEIIGPCNIQAYKKLGLEKSSTMGYNTSLMGYARSTFRKFESFLRIVVGSDEDDFQLTFNQYNSNFIACKITKDLFD